jgi:very-short-patch-repair endonuclease
MRRAPTEAEARLWRRLRRGLLGVRFRRQVVMGRFIADFYCAAAGLIVELDGSVHDERRDVDEERDRLLRRSGMQILRFRNEDVLDDLDAVLETLTAALAHPIP